MDRLAKRPERETIMVDAFYARLSPTVITEPVDVPPETVGTVYLLIYELYGWLPANDTRPPA